MRPYVLIEGPDGCGKTTLAQALVEQGMALEHAGAPEYSPLRYYMDALDRHPDGWAVLDRLHPSSFVYGNVFRGMDDLSPYEHWVLDGTLMGANTLMVYAHTSDEANDRNIAKGPRDADAVIYEEPSKQAEVRAAFEHYMRTLTPLPVIEYDFTEDRALERMVADVQSLAAYFDSAPMPIAGARPFGNQYSPRLCLVGVGPSRYLFRTLVCARVPLNQVCLVKEFPKSFGESEYWLNTEFVAMNDESARALSSAGLQFRTAPHPDWVEKRAYKEIFDYAKAITGENPWVEFKELARKGFKVVRKG